MRAKRKADYHHGDLRQALIETAVLATLWVDRALPFEGLEPERLAPEIGRLITRMFSALADRPA
jgi:hypothetical protein